MTSLRRGLPAVFALPFLLLQPRPIEVPPEGIVVTSTPALPASVARKAQRLANGPKRTDRPDDATEYQRRRRAPTGRTEVPVELYLTALDQAATMPRYSTAQRRVLPSSAGLSGPDGIRGSAAAGSLAGWEELGPGNVGGRTRALVIDPSNPNVMYAAGVAGGVWKTTDGGASWTPRGDLLANLAITSLAMSPANPRVLYAGTGEGFFNGDAIRGAGIFRTTNGGDTWTQLASTRTSDFHYVNDIVVSKSNPTTIYAATRTGIWRARNGSNWKQLLTSFVASDVGGCLDLALRTDVPETLLASCGTFERATVFRITSPGTTAVAKSVLRAPGMGRTSLAIAPSNQKIVYALAASIQNGPFENGLLGVFRSVDGGITWKAQVRNTSPRKIDRVLLSNPVFAFLDECFDGESAFFNQGWYDNVIAVDPKDPNKVWAGGIDLFRSDDGGKSWGIASYWWANPVDDTSYAHADHHVIAFHPAYDGTTNRRLYVGNDGGIFTTDNARTPTARTLAGICNPAVSKFRWRSLNNGYGVTQFYHGLPFPDGTEYLGGTQDNGTVRGDDLGGADEWKMINGGDGGFVALDPTDTDVLFSSNPGLALQRSVDGGETWEAVVDGIDEDAGNFLFVTPFVADPNQPNRLWIGGSRLWRTNDQADSWQAASTTVAADEFPFVSAITISPSSSDHVAVGTVEGFVHRTTTATTTSGSTVWAQSRPRAGWVTSVNYDPSNGAVIYVTYSTFGGGAHVWKSTDGGASWTPLGGTGAGTLPDVPVNSLAVDPHDGKRLWVGTDIGVFSSIDGGQTWLVENTGFANAPTWWLELQGEPHGPEPLRLFAFTHGRGVWRVPID
jgi:photosystem II stability/assembly factor-like uncharacterized protein